MEIMSFVWENWEDFYFAYKSWIDVKKEYQQIITKDSRRLYYLQFFCEIFMLKKKISKYYLHITSLTSHSPEDPHVTFGFPIREAFSLHSKITSESIGRNSSVPFLKSTKPSDKESIKVSTEQLGTRRKDRQKYITP